MADGGVITATGSCVEGVGGGADGGRGGVASAVAARAAGGSAPTDEAAWTCGAETASMAQLMRQARLAGSASGQREGARKGVMHTAGGPKASRQAALTVVVVLHNDIGGRRHAPAPAEKHPELDE